MIADVLPSPVIGISNAKRASEGIEYITEKVLFNISDTFPDRMASSVRRDAIARETASVISTSSICSTSGPATFSGCLLRYSIIIILSKNVPDYVRIQSENSIILFHSKIVPDSARMQSVNWVILFLSKIVPDSARMQ